METMQECRQYLNGGPAQVQIEPWRHAQVKIKPWIPVISEDQAKGAQMIGHPVAAISQEVIVDDKEAGCSKVSFDCRFCISRSEVKSF